MCGLAGVLDHRARTAAAALAHDAASMAATLRHRGPDEEDVWCDAPRGIALAHTRLSILDLSPTGHQPMTSQDGRWVLAFNGEIYNHDEIRPALQQAGIRLRGTSDTEVLLEAIAAWGPDAALHMSNGMFALAVWDRLTHRLLLARDRMGEKPLYYGEFGGVLLFASELKALHAHQLFRPAIDPAAVALYLRHGHVPSPRTIHQGVRKLPPGCLLWAGGPGPAAEPVAYWDLARVAERGRAQRWNGTPREAVDAVAGLAGDAVRLRMRADVPVGAFLSGGVDSSLVSALMRAHSTLPVRTFSIGFAETAYDESPHARAVARHLGTDHTELLVTVDEAMTVIPRLAEIYDEPFADASQIPTCLLAALTREHVTVSLSGDGGDELFAGYDRHRFHDRLAAGIRAVPRPLRPRLGEALAAGDPSWWDRRLGHVPALRGWAPPGRLGERAARVGELLTTEPGRLYRGLLSTWADPAAIARCPLEPDDAFPVPPVSLGRRGSAPLRWIDQRQYLPDDILVKIDRASMAVGLEARVPLLDHRLVELSWRLPDALLMRRGAGKRVLRAVLARHVPPELTERPKTGFGVPIGAWLRGPLRPWAGDLLTTAAAAHRGLLRGEVIERMWTEHLQRRADHGARLWNLVMLQSWIERWAPSP